MITINYDKSNTLTQNNYENFIKSINLASIPCSCGRFGCLTKHGYYNRRIKTDSLSKVTLSILRVKCNICGKTHAIVPISIIPYSSITLEDHLTIIKNYLSNLPQDTIMTEKPLIDESNISYIISRYKKFWHQCLIAFSISLYKSLYDITYTCFRHLSRHFMQIKWVQNIFVT